MNYRDAAQAALDCQNACNLSGVVQTFSRVMPVLWDEARKQGQGTDWVNRHPIVRVFLSKLADLNGDRFVNLRPLNIAAFKVVEEIANGS